MANKMTMCWLKRIVGSDIQLSTTRGTIYIGYQQWQGLNFVPRVWTHGNCTTPMIIKSGVKTKHRKLLTNRRSMLFLGAFRTRRTGTASFIERPKKTFSQRRHFVFLWKEENGVTKVTYQGRRRRARGIGCGGDLPSHSDRAPWTWGSRSRR